MWALKYGRLLGDMVSDGWGPTRGAPGLDHGRIRLYSPKGHRAVVSSLCEPLDDHTAGHQEAAPSPPSSNPKLCPETYLIATLVCPQPNRKVQHVGPKSFFQQGLRGIQLKRGRTKSQEEGRAACRAKRGAQSPVARGLASEPRAIEATWKAK